MKRRDLLALAAWPAAGALAQPVAAPATASEERLQRLLQSRAQAAGAGGSGVSPQRLALRESLLVAGEGALARRDAEAALGQFEKAALILHAADTEMGLVRCYMQAGDYRRALAFGAHTAGAHLDVVGGTALYAWLLHLGAQEGIARDLMAQADARSPMQPLLRAVAAELGRPWPSAGTALLAAPTRLAPYAEALPGARVVGTGTLVRDGAAALVPAASLRGRGRYWVRNGLGDTVAARAGRLPVRAGLAELVLEKPLPAPGLRAASSDPFPGSVGMALAFAPRPDDLPAWPLLKTGFIGAPLAQPGQRRLGVPLAAGTPLGGPVFDRQGQWIGVSVGATGGDRLAGVALLRDWAGADLAQAGAGEGPAPATGPDAVYERGLRSTLQLLRA